MSNEEIKTLIEQEAENRYKPDGFSEATKLVMSSLHGGFIAGATFYEQSILPEVLKEKDEEITKLNTAFHEKHLQACEWKNHADNLQAELSQLQSKMEEEKRKAFEAAKEYKAKYTMSENPMKYSTYEDYLKSTTQSTESNTK